MNYLYNGVELPALPEWDRVAYPYAIMVWGGTGGNRLSHCLLWAFSNPHHLTHYNSIQNKYSIWISEDEKCLYSQAKYNSKNGTYEPFPAMVEYPNETYPYNKNGLTSKTDWANYDVLDNKGTLYLAASDPIPVGTAPQLDPLSLFMGWKAGNLVARQRGAKKKPVAYLYNGVRLPALPEWDKEKYPYAVIDEWESTFNGHAGKIYFLSFYTEKIVWKRESNKWYMPGKLVVYATTDSAKIAEYFDSFAPGEVGFNMWGIAEEDDGIACDKVIWTSTDLVFDDGTLYLAASEPVPVYE